MLRINFVNQFDEQDKNYLPTIEKVLRQAYKTLHAHGRKVISVILVSDAEIQRINREFRKIDRVTDVISFDNQDGGPELGDVFIAVPRAKEQAESYGHPFARELGFLAVHHHHDLVEGQRLEVLEHALEQIGQGFHALPCGTADRCASAAHGRSP